MNMAEKDPCELAEAVHVRPISGLFEEKMFGSDRGNTVWVKFSDKLGINEWIGKFGSGGYGSTRVDKIGYPDQFFISAGGNGYVIDATSKELLAHHFGAYDNTLAYDSKTKRFIVADFTKLMAVEAGQIVWTSKRIALDGIQASKVDGRIIEGWAVTSYEGRESNFTFNLDTLEIKFKKMKRWWKLW